MSTGLLALALLGSAWAQETEGEAESAPAEEPPLAEEPPSAEEPLPVDEPPPVEDPSVLEPPSEVWDALPAEEPSEPAPEPDPIDAARTRIAELEEQLDASDARLEALAEEFRQARTEGDQLQRELDLARAELDDLLSAQEAADAPDEAGPVADEALPEDEAPPVYERETIAEELAELFEHTFSDAAAVSFVHGGVLGAQVGAALGFGVASGGDEESAILGGLGGAGIYALGGALGASAADLSLERAAAAHNASLMLSWAGYQVGRIGVQGPAYETKRILAFGAIGGIAGTGAGLAAGGLEVAPSTWYGASLGTAAGWSIGAGTASLLQYEGQERQARAGIGLGVGTGLGAAAFAAHHLGQPLPPPALAGLNMAQGTWVGGWAPFIALEEPGHLHRTGGMAVGLGAGYAVAAATSPLFQVDGKLLGLQGLGFATGTAIGAGIPLSTGIEAHPRGMVLPMLIGGVAGHVGGSLLAPSYQLQQADAYFLPLLQGWAVYQTIGWAIYGDQAATGRQAAGFALTAAGVGTAAAWTVPAVVDLSPPQTVLAFSGSLWGTWYGAWGAYLTQVPAGRRLAPTLVAGNIGLIGAALPEAFGWRPSWAQVGVINGGGALGAGLGALVGVLASPDAATIGTASLIGTTAGFVGGGLAASKLDDGDGASAAALVLPQPAWAAHLPFRTSLSATPWQDDEGELGAWVQADLTRRAR